MRSVICQILILLVVTGNLAWAADLGEAFASYESQQALAEQIVSTQDSTGDTQELVVPERDSFCYDQCCNSSACCSALAPYIHTLSPTPAAAFSITAPAVFHTRAAEAPPFPPNI